jgi:hypothetical protein
MSARSPHADWLKLPATGPLRAPRGPLTTRASALAMVAAYLIVSLTGTSSPRASRAEEPAVVAEAQPPSIVTLRANSIAVDGVSVLEALDITSDSPLALEALGRVLRVKRLLEGGGSRLLVELEGEVPPSLVKKVVSAATASGYPAVEVVALRS